MISVKHQLFSRRKITFKSLLCAALLAVIFVVASCGGVEPDDDSYAPPVEIPDNGDNAGNTGDGGNQGANEGSTGNGGNQGEQGDQGNQGDQGDQGDQGNQGEQGDQGEQGNQGNQGNQGDQGNQGGQGNENQDPDPDTPEKPDYNYESVKALLEKHISNYSTLSGEISNSKSITLTAQTINTILDIYPDLEQAVKNKNNEATAEASLKKATTDDIKKALIAEAEYELKVTKLSSGDEINGFFPDKYEINAKELTVKLSGDFDFNDYYFVKDNSTTIDLSAANFTTIYKINISELNGMYSDLKKLSSNLPKLTLNKDGFINDLDEEGVKILFDIYNDYNFSSDKLTTPTNWETSELNGKSWSNGNLFSGNSENTSNIKKVDIANLVTFTSKTNINKIKNIRITGSLSNSTNVSWTDLTNVIFEGDMSKLTINNNTDLKGIVYFKDLPYTNSKESLVEGAVKLDTFPNGFKLNKNSVNNFVLDLTHVNSYTGSPIGGSINAVYFNDNPDGKGTETLFEKIVEKETGVIFNVYYGNSRSLDSYNKFKATGNNEYYESSASKRSLTDFECYGNNGKYQDGGTVA